MGNEIKPSWPLIQPSYDNVLILARVKAEHLRPLLPPLPNDKDIGPFWEKMNILDQPLINAVKKHLETAGIRSPDHSYENHLEPVAVRAAYVAALECDERHISNEAKNNIIQRTWRLGLLHDIEARLGRTPEHQSQGAEIAEKILTGLGINDKYIKEQVLLHDNLDVEPKNDPEFDIPFFAVFAVDHLNWGKNLEEKQWKYLQEHEIPIEKAVHNTAYISTLENLRDGHCLKQTKWGKEVAIAYIDFGIRIAKFINSIF